MRRVIFIWTVILIVGCNAKDNTELIIRDKFENWKKEQIKSGQFLDKQKCNPDYIKTKEPRLFFGFPDSIDFRFADVNSDNVTDGLVTFIPDQCDGGNGYMWIQSKILILSKGDTFVTVDNFFDPLQVHAEGAYLLDSVSTNLFFGTYYQFTEDDAHCCPSIKRQITIKFDTKEIVLK